MAAKPRLRLPDSLIAAAAPALAEDLRARRGKPLQVDASAVKRLSALPAQVLLAAAAAWRADGQPLAIVAPSTEFAEALRLLGLDTACLAAGDPAP